MQLKQNNIENGWNFTFESDFQSDFQNDTYVRCIEFQFLPYMKYRRLKSDSATE